jgi:hypothetical protein
LELRLDSFLKEPALPASRGATPIRLRTYNLLILVKVMHETRIDVAPLKIDLDCLDIEITQVLRIALLRVRSGLPVKRLKKDVDG